MANLLKLKRPNSLGAPPPINEASQNLQASETAPTSSAPPPSGSATRLRKPEPKAPHFDRPSRETRIDGRSLRKSARLIPFANRVSEDFDERFRLIAQRDGLLFVELLERSLDAYEATRK